MKSSLSYTVATAGGSRSARRPQRWLWSITGCGTSDDGDEGASDNDAAPGVPQFEVPDMPDAGRGRRGRGRDQHPRLARVRRVRQERPRLRLGNAVREEDRLQGQRQGVRHLRRGGQPDGGRRVRRRLRLGRRDPAADRGRRRRSRSTPTWCPTTPTSRSSSRASRSTASTARCTASRTAGAPTS